MYVLHGFDAIASSTVVWEYDPAVHRWRKVEFIGDPVEPRCVIYKIMGEVGTVWGGGTELLGLSSAN